MPARLIRRVLIDLLGYVCIVLAFVLGWLPGPGGTPLLIAGFGLLSINNPWAKRVLRYLKTEGLKLADKVFPDRKLIALIWDVALIGLAVVAFGIYRYDSGFIYTVTSSLLLAVALYILTLNRRRVERFIVFLKNHNNKNTN